MILSGRNTQSGGSRFPLHRIEINNYILRYFRFCRNFVLKQNGQAFWNLRWQSCFPAIFAIVRRNCVRSARAWRSADSFVDYPAAAVGLGARESGVVGGIVAEKPMLFRFGVFLFDCVTSSANVAAAHAPQVAGKVAVATVFHNDHQGTCRAKKTFKSRLDNDRAKGNPR